jgi:Tol biopolymer transport system component
VARTLKLVALCAFLAAIAGGSSTASGSFPGRNGAITFDAVDGTTGTVQIFRVSGTGGGLKQLTTTSAKVWNEDPTFAASGQRIFFDSLDRATTRPSHIYRMNANGTGRQLSDGRSNPPHVWVSVNRTGSSLAMVQFTGAGQAVIATMNPNGHNLRVIARGTKVQSDGTPEYAPNNGRIAFERVTFNTNGQGIRKGDLIIRNGGRNVNITAGRRANYFGPSWAPNGQQLVAIRGQRTLVSLNSNGTNIRVLTTVGGQETNITDAVYSPDGKKIAYLQCNGDCGDPDLRGQGSIWVMNANGSGRHRVFNGGNGVQPAERLAWQSL